jgi:hypothetical protein
MRYHSNDVAQSAALAVCGFRLEPPNCADLPKANLRWVLFSSEPIRTHARKFLEIQQIFPNRAVTFGIFILLLDTFLPRSQRHVATDALLGIAVTAIFTLLG